LHWHGGEPMPLTNLTLDSDNPVLSPDGKSIFFLGRTPRGQLLHYSTHEKDSSHS